jgi:glycosyltransferase involved in cell wall biosynthesis
MVAMGTNIVGRNAGPRAPAAGDRLRVLLVAPPMLPIPPPAYAGTERVVAALGEELHRRGHHVALVAAGDSDVPYEHVPTLAHSLWPTGFAGDVAGYMQHTIAVAWREAHRFDIVHAHMEAHGFVFAEHCATPVVSTLHGRLDAAGMPALLDAHRDLPLVAVSENQRRWFPNQNWVGTIHHGLPLADMPFGDTAGDYLAFVGRVTAEKGLREALELSRLAGVPLRVAAKVHDERERDHFREVVQPAIEAGELDFLGEVGPIERDPLFAGALATIMLGAWPEPFGLVAIESMATGTPVIARRAGAFTETVEHGVTGFLVDDVAEAALALERVRALDRRAIRERTLARFSPERMVDQYEAVHRRLVEGRQAAG